MTQAKLHQEKQRLLRFALDDLHAVQNYAKGYSEYGGYTPLFPSDISASVANAVRYIESELEACK